MKVIQMVTQYETVDGKRFTDREQARKHERQYEREQEALKGMRSLLQTAINSSLTRQGNIDNVMLDILDKNVEIRKILLTYSQKQPKEKKNEDKVAA